jgi:hypothetical protein
MKKTIPTFKTDKEAEDFVATADLTGYDLSGGEVVRFELKRKDKSATGSLSRTTPRSVKSPDKEPPA